MKTYTSDYNLSARKGRADSMGWAALLYYNDEAAFLRFATHNIHYASLEYTGAIASIEFDESGFDPHTSENANTVCSIRINDELLGGQHTITNLIDGKGFINRKVSIFRYIENSGVSPIANDKEFNGIISEFWYDIENFQWVFECEHLHQHRIVPQTIITKESYPRAPQRSLGSPLPIVYGSFVTSAIGTRADHAHGLFHYAPTVCVDATKGLYCVAGHAVYAMYGTNIGIYLDGLRTYGVGLYSWDGSAADYPDTVATSPATVQIAIPAANGILKVENIWLMPKMKGVYNQVSGDSDNAVDGDYNTSLTVSASTRYATKFPVGGLGDGGVFATTGTTTQLKTYAFFKAHSGSAIAGGLYNAVLFDVSGGASGLYTPSSVSGTGYKTYAISSTSGDRSDNEGTVLTATDQWTWAEINLYEFYLSVPAASSVGISTFGIVANDIVVSGRIKETVEEGVSRTRGSWGAANPIPYIPILAVPFRRTRGATRRWRRVTYDYLPDPSARENGLSSIFCEVSGRMFSSWIGSRNGLASGQPIVKSNYIAESILRDEMGVDDADIDETAFDGDYSSAYTFAFSINKTESTQSIIADIADQSACYIYRKTDGIWTTLRIPATPSSSDVDFDYSINDVKFTNLYKTPQEWIQNEIRVLYNYDYASGVFTWDTSDEDTTSKGTTYLGNKATAIVDINADFIRKDSDSGVTNYATSLRDYKLSMWASRHNVLEFESLNPVHFCLEEGDVVTFQNVSINYGKIGSGSAGDYWSSFADSRTKYWLIFSRKPYLDRVEYKVMQLHNL